jgi:hypothetical protein
MLTGAAGAGLGQRWMEALAMSENRRLHMPHFDFRRRLSRNVTIAIAVVIVALGGGMLGYIAFEDMRPIDAFLNTAMIVSGMGPITDPVTDEGKIFAGLYAIFSGVMLVAIWGLILGPFLGRILTRLHIQEG